MHFCASYGVPLVSWNLREWGGRTGPDWQQPKKMVRLDNDLCIMIMFLPVFEYIVGFVYSLLF